MSRNSDDKSKFLKTLEEVPLISHAAQKVGIGRATIYRWRNSDVDFRERMDEAIRLGRLRWIEMVEGSLLKNANAGKSGDIHYFLEHNHPNYMPKQEKQSGLNDNEKKELERLRSGGISKEKEDEIIRVFENYDLIKKNKSAPPGKDVGP